MPGRNTAGLKLRCREGHWEWADWQMVPLTDQNGMPAGFGLVVRCHLGDHWLAEAINDPDGKMRVSTTPYPYDTKEQAHWARDRWEAQEARKHEA